MSRDPDAMTVQELAQRLGVSERTARAALRKGEIPHRKVLTRYVISRRVIEEWLARPGKEAQGNRFLHHITFGGQA